MIYLNNAATSFPKPDLVLDGVTEYIRSIPFNSKRDSSVFVKDDIVDNCRKLIAKLFHINDPNDIFFTSGATESLNLAIKGIELKNFHVITTATEHNSVLRPLKELERENLLELSIVDCDEQGFISPQEIKKSIRQNTKLIIINHCSNVVGTIQDISAISKIAQEYEVLLMVDASQSAGSEEINVERERIDILVFTGHKGLFSIPGIGGIYIRKNLQINPLKFGGTGVKSELLYQPEERPYYYEAGTQNIPGIVSLEKGISFILDRGIEKIRKRKAELFKLFINKILEVPKIVLYGNKDPLKGEPIFSFNLKGIPPENVGYILENSFHIIVRTGLHCAPLIHKCLGSFPYGSIRVSFSYFTKEDEIIELIEALKKIAGYFKNGNH